MSFNPRLPDLPSGNDNDPITLGYMRRHQERFYALWRELSDDIGYAQRGTWTPDFTYATVGDFARTLSIQSGWYHLDKNGLCVAQFSLVTSAFTHTTSAGALSITGLPFQATADANYVAEGSIQWQGITKANYTQWNPYVVSGTSVIQISGSGSGQPNVTLASADMPTGGNVVLIGTVSYRTS